MENKNDSIVITGSYNWSYKAESNFENVIITSYDTTLAEQFISEFNNIRKQNLVMLSKKHLTSVLFASKIILKNVKNNSDEQRNWFSNP
jgi:phosphatidylserine/phosphatidylglycerophosphate/cardiolipin synthase-like enzyme